MHMYAYIYNINVCMYTSDISICDILVGSEKDTFYTFKYKIILTIIVS